MDRRLPTLQLLLVSSSEGVAGGDNMHIDITIAGWFSWYPMVGTDGHFLID